MDERMSTNRALLVLIVDEDVDIRETPADILQ
jgi:hypothetical protein